MVELQCNIAAHAETQFGGQLRALRSGLTQIALQLKAQVIKLSIL